MAIQGSPVFGLLGTCLSQWSISDIFENATGFIKLGNVLAADSDIWYIHEESVFLLYLVIPSHECRFLQDRLLLLTQKKRKYKKTDSGGCTPEVLNTQGR
jgi:hypothetical protein